MPSQDYNPKARHSGALSHYTGVSLHTVCHMSPEPPPVKENKEGNSCLKANVTSLAPMGLTYLEHLDFRKKWSDQ